MEEQEELQKSDQKSAQKELQKGFIIPKLPDDLAIRCLANISNIDEFISGYNNNNDTSRQTLKLACKSWKEVLAKFPGPDSELLLARREQGLQNISLFSVIFEEGPLSPIPFVPGLQVRLVQQFLGSDKFSQQHFSCPWESVCQQQFPRPWASVCQQQLRRPWASVSVEKRLFYDEIVWSGGAYVGLLLSQSQSQSELLTLEMIVADVAAMRVSRAAKSNSGEELKLRCVAVVEGFLYAACSTWTWCRLQHPPNNNNNFNLRRLYVHPYALGPQNLQLSNRLRRYDFGMDSWTSMPNLPFLMHILHMAAVQGRLLLIGRRYSIAENSSHGKASTSTGPSPSLLSPSPHEFRCISFCPESASWEEVQVHDDEGFLDEAFMDFNIEQLSSELEGAVPHTLAGPPQGQGNILFRLWHCRNIQTQEFRVEVQMSVVLLSERSSSSSSHGGLLRLSPWHNVSGTDVPEDWRIRHSFQLQLHCVSNGICVVIVRFSSSKVWNCENNRARIRTLLHSIPTNPDFSSMVKVYWEPYFCRASSKSSSRWVDADEVPVAICF